MSIQTQRNNIYKYTVKNATNANNYRRGQLAVRKIPKGNVTSAKFVIFAIFVTSTKNTGTDGRSSLWNRFRRNGCKSSESSDSPPLRHAAASDWSRGF